MVHNCWLGRQSLVHTAFHRLKQTKSMVPPQLLPLDLRPWQPPLELHLRPHQPKRAKFVTSEEDMRSDWYDVASLGWFLLINANANGILNLISLPKKTWDITNEKYFKFNFNTSWTSKTLSGCSSSAVVAANPVTCSFFTRSLSSTKTRVASKTFSPVRLSFHQQSHASTAGSSAISASTASQKEHWSTYSDGKCFYEFLLKFLWLCAIIDLAGNRLFPQLHKRYGASSAVSSWSSPMATSSWASSAAALA